MESIIKWNTKNCKEFICRAIVTVLDKDGNIFVCTDYWSSVFNGWKEYNEENGYKVIAWYKISDIKPYKEEKE